MKCCVPLCINNSGQDTKSSGITFHAFPKNEGRQIAWAEALGLNRSWLTREGLVVCSEHFRSEELYVTKCGVRKVKSGAVPVFVQNSFEDLEAPATARTCKICMSIDAKMYNMKEHKLDLVYTDVTGMPVSSDDNLPQKLCWECTHRLQICANFKSKAILSQCLMQEVLARAHYLTIRDIRSIKQSRPDLQSTLLTKHLDLDNSETVVEDELIFVKEEQDGEMKEEVAPITEVEIKDEQTNSEIFVEEFLDFDESDDNKTLSEVVTHNKDKNKVKKIKKRKLKEDKVEKKVKKKEKKERNEEEKVEEDDPNITMDKYKKTDVRRRRTQDCLDETLFTITTMTYDEQIAEIQKRQDSTNYRTAPYKCDVCYRGFLIKDRYTAHIVRHSEACGAYECFICKTRLRSGRALRKHLTAQHTEKFSCKGCPFITRNRQCFICKTRLRSGRALRKHLTAQHTEKFSCKGCPFITRNRGVAREHEKWHAGTKYQCPHCPSQFDKVTTYMGHIRIKHVSDFVCELCGYTFVSEKGILVHKKKKHRLDQEVELTGPFCETCNVRFKCDEAHERHLKLSSRHSSDNDPNRIRNDSQSMNVERIGRVMRKLERRPVIHPRDPNTKDHSRPEPSGPVTCEQCGIQLRDLRLYAQHFRRAHPDKNRTKYPAMKTPCMCEQCGRIFQSMALLKDHMWVHTGEKRFKCDRCEKSFTQKTNLVFHMRVHSNARPTYECPLCGKHFAFINNRRRHMFIHTGLKPYKCDTCGKCFTTQGEQRAHVEHVHMKKPWPKRVRGHRQGLPSAGDIDHQGWDKGQVED